MSANLFTTTTPRALALAAGLAVLGACGSGSSAPDDATDVAAAPGQGQTPSPAPSSPPVPSPGPTPSTGPGPGGAPSPPPVEAPPVRIMVIGDSMTSGGEESGQPYRSYRGFLFQRLTALGCRVDFIGSRSNVPYDGGDPDHDGYPGRLAGPDDLGVDRDTIYDRIVGNNGFTTILGPDVAPDLVVLALGWNSARYRPAGAAGQYRRVVEAVSERRPGAALVLATLSPRYRETESRTAAALPGYGALNATARALAAASPTDRRVLADLAVGGFASPDYVDEIHWTATGAQLAAGIIGDAILDNGLLDCPAR